MDLKVYLQNADQYITIETGISEPSQFKMFDMIGRLVLIKEVSDKEQLSVETLKAGMYYYKLVADSKLQTGKLWLKTP
jgi:hypothetical protein